MTLAGRFYLQLASDVSDFDIARLHNLGVDSAKLKLFALRAVQELQGVDAETGHELLAAGMGLVGCLDDC